LRKGFDKAIWCKTIKRTIQKYVEDSLAEEITSKFLQEMRYSWILKESSELSVKFKTEEPINRNPHFR
jgi:ATP-dependent Clp protease ATP-binding subunit ClpC